MIGKELTSLEGVCVWGHFFYFLLLLCYYWCFLIFPTLNLNLLLIKNQKQLKYIFKVQLSKIRNCSLSHTCFLSLFPLHVKYTLKLRMPKLYELMADQLTITFFSLTCSELGFYNKVINGTAKKVTMSLS